MLVCVESQLLLVDYDSSIHTAGRDATIFRRTMAVNIVRGVLRVCGVLARRALVCAPLSPHTPLRTRVCVQEAGGKIFLPPSALRVLLSLNIEYPMLFEVRQRLPQ